MERSLWRPATTRITKTQSGGATSEDTKLHYYGKLNIIRALISARFKPAVQIASDLEKKKTDKNV